MRRKGFRVPYVSGPIAGRPDRNAPMFDAARRYLESLPEVDFVVVPHDLAPHPHPGQPCPAGYRSEGTEHAAACHLRTDLYNMLGGCTEVWFLPEWESSVGARLEMQVAAACGMPLFFLKCEIEKVIMEVGPALSQAYRELRNFLPEAFPPEAERYG